MAHNINTYVGRQAAWHALGAVTGTYQTWQDILQHGGLDYQVFKSQLHDGLGRQVDAYGVFRWDKADRAKGDKRAATFLGAVGADYKTIDHATGFELIDALMQTASGAHYETAGCLGAGETVWGLADLSLTMSVGDDKHEVYLLFSTGHIGNRAYELRLTDTRVVCQNTLDLAVSQRTSSMFRVRHTRNAQSRIDDAHVALQSLTADVLSMQDKLRFLATRRINRESLQSIMSRLFPTQKKVAIDAGTGATEAIETSSARRDNILASILELYENNDDNTFPEQRGTAYNLLNAITAYTDHARSSKVGGRAESALFGSGNKLKSDAFDTIYQAASSLPSVPKAVQIQSFSDIGLNVGAA